MVLNISAGYGMLSLGLFRAMSRECRGRSAGV